MEFEKAIKMISDWYSNYYDIKVENWLNIEDT